ncbi:hydrolase [Capsulimonas corticalis]|uniref:Hydrolase n=1 Tax=Capsulimonas corticalis TaxID=2219043 RepID=A0A402CVG5_9BACT|nr:hydrolase [Capsulimonas corticalis]
MSIPRAEYPRPQFVRSEWLSLNGEWEFEIDNGDSGLDRGLRERALEQRITVPFCPESPLSGVDHKDFMLAVWYRRVVTLPSEWSGKRVLLHFQAVDYDTTVWANGVEVGRHRGGFSPFSCDLNGVAAPGETVTIVVRARDDYRTAQPRGKQATKYAPYACLYTRTTGIWQSVWLEPVADVSLKRPRITPDVANSTLRIQQQITNNRPGYRVRASVSDGDGVIAQAECRADLDLAVNLDLRIPEDRLRLWGPEDPFLYDLTLEILDASGAVVDRAESYAGMRSVAIDGLKVKLNGKVVFQRLILDQGYYPDGVMTAPTEDALIADIQMSLDAGFNGARLHQKVFEERFLYHADRMGYLVWGEFADWGCGGFGPSHDHQQMGITYATQWLEVLERDYSHPSIIGWCPLNETWQNISDTITTLDDATRAMFLATKAMDTSRPVLDTSGYSHRVREADIYDAHDYIMEGFEEGLATRIERYSKVGEGVVYINFNSDKGQQPNSVPYNGQPYFVSEFGGFRWNPKEVSTDFEQRDASWGYGSDPESLENLHHRFEKTCDLYLLNENMFAYCYTQLTDIYPEENGIYTFDRKPKFDIARIHAIQTKKAAIESAE